MARAALRILAVAGFAGAVRERPLRFFNGLQNEGLQFNLTTQFETGGEVIVVFGAGGSGDLQFIGGGTGLSSDYLAFNGTEAWSFAYRLESSGVVCAGALEPFSEDARATVIYVGSTDGISDGTCEGLFVHSHSSQAEVTIVADAKVPSVNNWTMCFFNDGQWKAEDIAYQGAVNTYFDGGITDVALLDRADSAACGRNTWDDAAEAAVATTELRFGSWPTLVVVFGDGGGSGGVRFHCEGCVEGSSGKQSRCSSIFLEHESSSRGQPCDHLTTLAVIGIIVLAILLLCFVLAGLRTWSMYRGREGGEGAVGGEGYAELPASA